jgi:predicted Zn-dependent peptidase
VTEIREERGWAYSVRAEADALSDAAALYVTAGLDSSHAVDATHRAVEIVDQLTSEGPSEDEVDRARSAAAGRRALAFENTTMAAIHIAEELLVHGCETDPAAAVQSLDRVQVDEVAAVAAATTGTPAIACVGPLSTGDFS